MNGTYDPSGSERALALMMPAVTVLSKPYGEPIATTHSPTFESSVAGNFTVGKFFASIFSTATSEALSKPTTLALNSRLSVSFTLTTEASATTCALVRMTPSALTMKPEPSPRIGISFLCCGIPKPRKNCENGSSGSSLGIPRCCIAVFSSLDVTLMLTTAGPCDCTIEVKLGSAAYTGVFAGTTGTATGAAACDVIAAGVTACTSAGCVPSEVKPANAANDSAPAATRLRTNILGFMVFLL